MPYNLSCALRSVLLLPTAVMLWCAAVASADTAVGDWGHFLSMASRVHLHNPDGKAFRFTVHQMRWPIAGWSWNSGDFPMRVVDPRGRLLMEGQYRVEGNARTFDIEAGPPGRYLVEFAREDNPRQMVNLWLSSTLDRAVAGTGDPDGSALTSQWLVTQPSVPRRWWFWVPAGTAEFTIRTQRDIGNTEREAPGITLFTPRGQRIAALFGQPFKGERMWAGDKRWRGNLERRVRVDPGNAGRFWSVEVRLGDGHNYANVNFSLDGVPPYVARSPEEWFCPDTGGPAPMTAYDESKFMQSVADETLPSQMWSPAPALGDPDGVQLLGTGRFALWNPEGRALSFDICDYLVREPAADAPVTIATVTIDGAGGKRILETQMPVPHHHDGARQPRAVPPTGRGVARFEVSGAPRWFAYTYPATPLVWIGQTADDGYARFTMEVGTARNWYFHVPPGTQRFHVRARTGHASDVVHLEVNAPDRTQALLYGREGELAVDVPQGLDGRIWHLRPDIGSATRIETSGNAAVCRYLAIELTLDIKGVPGFLAPTWEQWFDPENPQPASRR